MARTAGLEAVRAGPFTRDGNGADLPRDLVSALFEAEAPGAVVTGETPEGWAVARLEDVSVPEASGEALADMRGQAAAAVANDLLTAYTEALNQRYGVEINRDVLEERL